MIFSAIWIEHFGYIYRGYVSQTSNKRLFFDVRKEIYTKVDDETYFDKHNMKYLTCESTKVSLGESFFEEEEIGLKTGRIINFVPNDTKYTMLHKYRIKALE